ncbi:MAG TPA: response regulator [Nitrospira sp.]
MASTIFVIDSSPAVRRMVEQISTPAGFDVIGFQDGPAALEAARRMSPTLIITDYHLDNMTFSGFCKEVHKLDTLSDTYIIALTGASDKFEEGHLKSLGVKAFLKKPFQSEHLLDLIKDLEHTNADKTASAKKKRSWPPTSSATDSDEDLADDEEASEDEAEVTFPFPVQGKAVDKKESSVPVQREGAPSSPSPSAEPEEAMKGLFGQLLQSMSGKTEKKIGELLPQMVGTKLETLVSQAAEKEVHLQLGTAVSQERLAEVVEPLLSKALSKVLTDEMSVLEPIIRHSIHEIASPLIKDHVERMVREQSDTVRDLLPEAVRKQLQSMEDDIRRQLKESGAAQTERVAPEVIRTVAEEQIQSTVQKMIPSIVEDAIRAEIKRLTDAA